MQLKRVEITELVGVNRNAVEGVAQTSPTQIKGFNFGEAGGYFAAFSQDSASILDNLSTSVIAYDEFGLALFDNSRVLYNGAVSDQSSGSIAPLRQYIVPRVGVGTDPLVSGSDAYLLGAFAKDSTEKVFRDLPRATGVTISVAGGGSSIPNATLNTLTYFFAPTAEGFLAYESYAEAIATGSTGNDVTVTADSVLPQGFLMKSYLGTDPTSVDPSYYLDTSGSSTVPTRDDYSDGATSMSVTFDNYSTSAGGTLDALISYCGGIACVEPHNQRVWGKASQAALTGPFIYAYNPASTLQTENFSSDTTNSSSTWASNYNGGTEAVVRVVRGSANKEVQYTAPASGGVPAFDSSLDFYFGGRFLTGLSSWQFAAGIRLRANTAPLAGRYKLNIYAEWVGEANGTEVVIPIKKVYQDEVNYSEVLTLDLEQKIMLERTDFLFDLTAGTFTVDEYDAGGNLISSSSTALSAGASFTSTPSAPLTVGGYSSAGSGFSNVKQHFDFQSVYFYSAVAMAATIAELNAGDWDGSSTTVTSTSPTGETWSITPSQALLVPGALPSTAQLDPDVTIVYSNIGFVNWGTSENYLKLPFTTSTKITALRSTPAGLVVFGQNEAFLIRSDPALPDFASQRFVGTLGCDEGVRPARLGGHIFTIWKGRLFAIALGMGDVDFGSGLSEIGQPLYDPEDPFVQVVGEPRTRHLIARTQGGKVYRYSTDVGQWCTDPWDGVANLNYLLPNIDSNGTRYVVTNDAYVVADIPGAPSVKWENLDLGDKGMKKLWRRVRVFTSDDYSGTPSLNYVINGSSGSVTATEEGTGWWVFTLPAGIVSEKADSLEVVMNGAAFGDEFEPPVIVEYVDRYSRR